MVVPIFDSASLETAHPTRLRKYPSRTSVTALSTNDANIFRTGPFEYQACSLSISDQYALINSRSICINEANFNHAASSSKLRRIIVCSKREDNIKFYFLYVGGAGLNCFSCGSLLDPSRKCDKFDATNPEQVQVCGRNEACLLYRWKKSNQETGNG